MWIKLDVFRIISYKDDAIYKTQLVGGRWFKYNDAPERNIKFNENGFDCIYVNTMDTYFGEDKPQDTI